MSEKFRGDISPQREINTRSLLESINSFDVGDWTTIRDIEEEIYSLKDEHPDLDLNNDKDVVRAFNKALIDYYDFSFSYGRRLESTINDEKIEISEDTKTKLAKIAERELAQENIAVEYTDSPHSGQVDYLYAINKYNLSVDFENLRKIFEDKIKNIDQHQHPFEFIEQISILENFDGLELTNFIELDSKDIENVIQELWYRYNRPSDNLVNISLTLEFAKKYIYKGSLPVELSNIFKDLFDKMKKKSGDSSSESEYTYKFITEKLGIKLFGYEVEKNT